MNIDDEVDDVAALLDSGKLDENASIEDIVAVLNGDEPGKTDANDPANAGEGQSETGDANGGEAGSKLEGDAAGTQAGDKSAATEANNADASGRAQQATEGQSQANEDPNTPFSKHPIYGVLSGTRRDLSEARRRLQEVEQERERERQERERERQERERAERELNELRARAQSQRQADAQATKDVQAAASAAGVKGDVRTVDIETLRDNFPREIVDSIELLQSQLLATHRELTDLRGRESQRQETEEDALHRELQQDIDSVPVLAGWQTNDKLKWKAACAIDDELAADPAWKGKTRVERFQEVVRQMGGAPTGQQQTQQQSSTDTAAGKKKVDDALAAAAASAVPYSHSGLPAGSAPGQSEAQSLNQLHVTQIADKFASMRDDQIEALLERIG